MSTMPDLPPAPLADVKPELAPARPRRHLRLAPPPASTEGWAAGPADGDFEAFVRRYEGRLLALALRRLGDRGDAEEIAQETLLRAYQHRANFHNEDELMAWSTVVAGRLVIDRTRVRGRSVAVGEVPEGNRAGRDTADIVVARHEARAALDALEAMPARQAAILWAREVEGLSYDEIARRFEMSEPTVRSLLHRGRRTLRKEYASRGGTLPVAGLIVLSPWLRGLQALRQLRTGAKVQAVAVSAVSALSVLAIAIGGGAFRAPSASAAGARNGASALQAAAPRAVSAHGASAASSADLARIARVATADSPGNLAGVPAVVPCRVVAGREACVGGDHSKPADRLWLGPALPDNPTGIRRVGVAADGPVNCQQVPDTLVTHCGPNPPDGSVPPPATQPNRGALR
ncbi:MAG: sigma-70 family RNA polymerase sigma factor [Frankia sp.]|nr:sigma-70 family RNA polymerase sigma factor [Frankia sp.]